MASVSFQKQPELWNRGLKAIGRRMFDSMPMSWRRALTRELRLHEGGASLTPATRRRLRNGPWEDEK